MYKGTVMKILVIHLVPVEVSGQLDHTPSPTVAPGQCAMDNSYRGEFTLDKLGQLSLGHSSSGLNITTSPFSWRNCLYGRLSGSWIMKTTRSCDKWVMCKMSAIYVKPVYVIVSVRTTVCPCGVTSSVQSTHSSRLTKKNIGLQPTSIITQL